MAETLASFESATAGTPSTACSDMGVERFAAGAADLKRKAPCWVLKEQPWWPSHRVVVSEPPGMTWSSIPCQRAGREVVFLVAGG